MQEFRVTKIRSYTDLMQSPGLKCHGSRNVVSQSPRVGVLWFLRSPADLHRKP